MTDSHRTGSRRRCRPGRKLIGVAAGAGLVAAAVVAGCVVRGTGGDESSVGDPSPSPSATSRAPQVLPVGYAPYVTYTTAEDYDMAAAATSDGVEEFNLAFITADDDCAPAWDGSAALASEDLTKRIAALRAAGGDVRVSFGGAEGTELARACTGVSALAAAYTEVIDAYDLTKVDFDIEGDTLADTDANARRAAAVAQLKEQAKAEGRSLDISFTLAATPTGLTDEGLDLLNEALDEGVDPSTVNIMAMNYGETYDGDMGGYAIEAATAAQAQIKSALGLSGTDAWQALAITPMIGVNDIATETFTLDDATELADFAKSKGLGWLSMWSLGRDRRCAGGPKPEVDTACSGVEQTTGAYGAALAAVQTT